MCVNTYSALSLHTHTHTHTFFSHAQVHHVCRGQLLYYMYVYIHWRVTMHKGHCSKKHWEQNIPEVNLLCIVTLYWLTDRSFLPYIYWTDLSFSPYIYYIKLLCTGLLRVCAGFSCPCLSSSIVTNGAIIAAISWCLLCIHTYIHTYTM